MKHLTQWGWTPYFENQLSQDDRSRFLFARITEEQKGLYWTAGDYNGWAEVTGRFRHEATNRADFPSVGDWVMLTQPPGSDRASIHQLLDRKSKLSRHLAGGSPGEQLVAANVDTVLLLSSLNQDLNLRRIERFLAVIWDAGATPVLVLNKADLCTDPASVIAEISARIPQVQIFAMSAMSGAGVEALAEHLLPAQTLVLLGSSGVGKSSLANRLLGTDEIRVHEIRSHDDRGMHTTTSRQLRPLPSGALLIDTPGIRELKLWDAEEGLGQTFNGLSDFEASCRFTDCQHRSEPGCAVQDAISRGILSRDQVENFQKLEREADRRKRRTDRVAASAERRVWKQNKRSAYLRELDAYKKRR